MSKLQAKPDGSIQKIWCWFDKGLMKNEKCPGIFTQKSPVSLNSAPREKARLEGGSNFHGRLPEDEDWVSWRYDYRLFTHKEQEKHCREIGLVIIKSQGRLTVYSLLTSIEIGEGELYSF